MPKYEASPDMPMTDQEWRADVRTRYPNAIIAFGMGGPSRYRGLDAHHPALRPMIDASIKILEARIAAGRVLPQDISDDICDPGEYFSS